MHRYDFHETDESMYFYDEELEDDLDIEPDIDFDLELDQDEVKKHSKLIDSKSRRSVDEYLEKKRLRKRYKDLFDDYFGENS
ncbi:MAG: hypothetical protein HKM04_05440 [Legionellales bacterium]|nr:hypothetical protein [Legionellales bacterium]